MPRPAVHGARVRALTVKSQETARIDQRTRRQLAKLQTAFGAEPLEAVRDSLVGHIARKTLLAQRAEAGLLAAADLGAEVDGLGKFATWVWNSLRRDGELLLLLEEKVAAAGTAGETCAHCGTRFADLPSYLGHRSTCPPAAPAGVGNAAVAPPTADAAQPAAEADSAIPAEVSDAS